MRNFGVNPVPPASLDQWHGTSGRLTIDRLFIEAKQLAIDVLALAAWALLTCVTAAGIGVAIFILLCVSC